MREFMSKRLLRQMKKTADEALKKQTREGLAKVFTKLGYKGVAREIKAGRNVRGNVQYGMRMIHDKLGPRVNVTTLKVTPQTKKAKKLERKFLLTANKLLKAGGYRAISPKLLMQFKRKDKQFEKKMEMKRRTKRKKR